MNNELPELPLVFATRKELSVYLASVDRSNIFPGRVSEIRQAASRLGVDIDCPDRPGITDSEYFYARMFDDKKTANEWDNFALNFIARIKLAIDPKTESEPPDEIELIARGLTAQRGAIFRFLARKKSGVTFDEFFSYQVPGTQKPLTSSLDERSVETMLRKLSGALEIHGWEISVQIAKNLILARKTTK